MCNFLSWSSRLALVYLDFKISSYTVLPDLPLKADLRPTESVASRHYDELISCVRVGSL